MRFSIVSKVDPRILSRKIDDYKNSKDYRLSGCTIPIILMAPETINEIRKEYGFDTDFLNESGGSTYIVTRFNGCKVFSDPTLKFGDVEMR